MFVFVSSRFSNIILVQYINLIIISDTMYNEIAFRKIYSRTHATYTNINILFCIQFCSGIPLCHVCVSCEWAQSTFFFYHYPPLLASVFII